VVVRDDLSGTVEKVNAALLRALLDSGYAPVVSPPAITAAGEAINVDGDRAAARIAAGLGAETLLLLSDVPGLLSAFPDPASLVARLQPSEVEAAAAAHATGRMRVKLLGAAEAVAAGVGRVVLGDSRGEGPVRAALAGRGTLIAS
jgi:acetylglutamate/LysW-gamma-L-alpha-aminoadipate kinase